MTSKLSWIAFVPFTLASLAIKVIQLFFLSPDGTFMGFNSLMLSYLSVACAVVVMLFAVIFCLVDRKTAQVYVIERNAVCGITGLLLAVCMACEGANRAFYAFRSIGVDKFEIIDIALTIFCAIVFVVLGLNHFVGNGGVKGLAVFYLVPTLWSAFRLVKCFLGFTTVSIAVTDITILACYVFTTLFLFNYAMIVALMKGKSPVRSAYIYGLPAVTMLLSYSVFEITKAVHHTSLFFNLFSNLPYIELFLLSIYILAFVIEMSAKVKRVDEIEIEGDEDEDEYGDIESADGDIVDTISNSVKYGNKPDEAVRKVLREGEEEDFLAEDDQVFLEVAQASMNTTDDYSHDVDLSDFIYGQAPSDDEYIVPETGSNDDSAYAVKDEDTSHYITQADSTYDEEDESDSPREFDMDRIDQLILEISEDEFN